MSKEIKFANEARQKIKDGIDKATKAVAPTLGAIGMSAIIDFEGLDPIISDDGITILKNLEFKDKYENIGLKMLRKGAMTTSLEAGDGTATTTVLTQAIIEQVFKEIKDSSKIQEVKIRLENGLKEVLDELSKLKREVKEEEIEQIALISCLDAEMAKIIADIIKEVGINGVVTVEKSAKQGYSSEVVKGARFNKGLISPFFINDFERSQTILENAHIVLVDRKISMNEQILPILNSIGTGNDILFIADEIDSVALGSLAHNAVNKIANIACVRNPYTGQRAKDFLFDLASLTGATVISEERGMKLEQATKELCGKAEKVIVTKDNCTIVGGISSPKLEERIKEIQNELENSTSDYTKETLEERIAMLTGGIGVIRVGTFTDTEFNSKKLKFDNAVNATQAALQEGIVIGGGSALAKIRTGEKMIDRALIAPLRQQAKNAGMNHKKVVKDISKIYLDEYGINFKTKEYVDMFKEGIIDPFKVVRLALESAVNIASNLLVCETVIIEEAKDVK